MTKTFRKATMNDVEALKTLINAYAQERLMLSRPLSELYDNLRDFWVCETKTGTIVGTVALHPSWEHLAEIKCLAVATEFCGQGIAHQLIKLCLEDAQSLSIHNVFALTYIPEFFQRFEFNIIDKSILPHKVWSECIRCLHFPDCGEIAVSKDITNQ